MQLVINDANILIDLADLELLSVFSRLNFKLFTTDFILEELNPAQRHSIDRLVSDNEILIIETSEVEDYLGINALLARTNGLSFEDCSVWYYSKKLKCTLLTGDARLRKLAVKDGVEVRGIIYIFDEIVRQNLLSKMESVMKIKKLKQLNSRLPRSEIDKRIRDWEE